MNEDWVFKRGDLYYANLNPYFGSEQGGTRPVLVLQNNMGNFFLSHLDCRAAHQQMDQEKGTPGSLYSGKRSRAGPEIGCSVRTNQND